MALRLEPDVATFTSLVRAAARGGDHVAAARWFYRLGKFGIESDRLIFSAAMSSAVRTGDLGVAEQLFRHACAKGIPQDLFNFNVLIDAAAKQQNLTAAHAWFQAAREARLTPDAITFNSLIHAASAVKPADAERWYLEACAAGIDQGLDTLNTVLHAFARTGDMVRAEAFFSRIAEAGLKPDVYSFGAMINGYAKRGDLKAATARFAEMEAGGFVGTVIQFNQLLKACANASPPAAAYAEELFRHMVASRGLRPDQVALRSLGRLAGSRRLAELCRKLGVDQAEIMGGPDDTRHMKWVLSPPPWRYGRKQGGAVAPPCGASQAAQVDGTSSATLALSGSSPDWRPRRGA
uniref:Pentacotripeptide-repeat region of PRORP domain-containing protein n=1 Tax=Alexandrium monilatum TaxID=311494 RepID=A0A7S4Q2R4_9DINO